jgi:outer membrane murein-binding lipoprotein Lpp
MTRITKLMAVMLAGILVLGLAGCDQTKDANAAISAANELSQEYTALDEKIATLMDEASTAEMTAAGVVPGIAALDEASTRFTERKDIIGQIEAEFQKIEGYDVADEIKTYAAQQVEIAKLLGQMDDLGIKLIADTKSLYELIKSGSDDTAKVDELSASIAEVSQQLGELDTQVTEKQTASDTYFIDSGLGK